MIKLEIYETKKVFEVKNTWDELSQDEFVFLAGLLWEYSNRQINRQVLQKRFFIYLEGINPAKVRFHGIDLEQYHYNLEFISGHIHFMFKDSGEINIDFDKFLLTEIKLADKNLKSCEFEFKPNGLIVTDIKAEQLLDAISFYSLYTESGDKTNLVYLTACLFNEGEYQSTKVFKNIDNFQDLDEGILFAVFLQFSAFLNFINKKTKYGILWENSKNSDHNKISIGIADLIYSLSKSGYGTKQEVAQLNVIEFLDMLLKGLIDTVKEYNYNKISVDEIAEKTGLSIETIQKII